MMIQSLSLRNRSDQPNPPHQPGEQSPTEKKEQWIKTHQ
jgi:hypothetical protein